MAKRTKTKRVPVTKEDRIRNLREVTGGFRNERMTLVPTLRMENFWFKQKESEEYFSRKNSLSAFEVTKEVFPYLYEDVKIGATADFFNIPNTYDAVAAKWQELIQTWYDKMPELEARRLKEIAQFKNTMEYDAPEDDEDVPSEK